MILAFGVVAIQGVVSANGWNLFSNELRKSQSQLESSTRRYDELGPIQLRQTVPQAGGQTLMTVNPPPQAAWIQLDLGRERSFDRIMIVPAILGVADDEVESYAFPRRFRVDASSSENFGDFEMLYDSGNAQLDITRPLPVTIDTPNATARYVRVTISNMALVANRWTYALSEVMVICGDRNVALGAAVTMTQSNALPPVWDQSFLTDGRTPLGPPIRRSRSGSKLPKFDGVFCQAGDLDAETWFQIDLESVREIDAIRLFPVHARQGADYPGYAFPLRFRIEASIEPSNDPDLLPESVPASVRKTELHLAGLARPDEAKSLGARLPKALWGRCSL